MFLNMQTCWHITSRNRANKIMLSGVQPTDQDNFGAFMQLGPQLLALVGSKPVYVSIDGLCSVSAHDFARRLHVGPQQLRAVQLDLTSLELHADLPALSESYRLLFQGDRVLIGGPDLPERRGREGELHEALRRAARARKDAESVNVKAFDDPKVLALCIELTGSACLASVSRDRILGVYTLAQAEAISDYARSQRRAG